MQRAAGQRVSTLALITCLVYWRVFLFFARMKMMKQDDPGTYVLHYLYRAKMANMETSPLVRFFFYYLCFHCCLCLVMAFCYRVIVSSGCCIVFSGNWLCLLVMSHVTA